MTNINLSSIVDPIIRDAIRQLQDEVNNQQILLAGLKVFTIALDTAVSNHKITHGLGYVPTDIIVSKSSGSTYTFEWQSFTKDHIYITTMGAVNIRFFIGRSTSGVVLT